MHHQLSALHLPLRRWAMRALLQIRMRRSPLFHGFYHTVDFVESELCCGVPDTFDHFLERPLHRDARVQIFGTAAIDHMMPFRCGSQFASLLTHSRRLGANLLEGVPQAAQKQVHVIKRQFPINPNSAHEQQQPPLGGGC
eukprot:2153922-Amphidinium_carterae.2